MAEQIDNMTEKMDTVRSWMDASEVRRLAEELMAPSSEKSSGVSDPSTDLHHAERGATDRGDEAPSDIGSTHAVEEPASPRPMVSSVLANARRLAEGSGMLHKSLGQAVSKEKLDNSVAKNPVAIPTPDELNFDASDLPPLVSKWAEQFDFDSLVMMGTDDFVYIDTLENARLTEMARKLAKAMPDTGHLFVRVGAGACLQVILLPSSIESLAIGVLVSAPMGGDQVKKIVAAVLQDLA